MSNQVDKDMYNPMHYKEKYDKSSKDELSFFDTLQKTIKDKVQHNRQVTINNLNAAHKSLSDIRKKAKKLTDSIIQHDDEMVIEKQSIINEALKKIHHHLEEVYQYETQSLDERVFSIENLHSRLVESNMEYFKSYKYFLSGTIDNVQGNHEFLEQKSESINYVIQKHFEELTDEFSRLDKKISKIDDQIKQLIAIKSHKEDILDEFFDIEIKNLVESQINFNINQDPYSDEIQSLTKQKKQQFDQYRSHLHRQEEKLKDLFSSEIDDQYDIFYHEKYQKTNHQSTAQKYAKRKIKSVTKEKKAILYAFKKENLDNIKAFHKNLKLYQKLYKTDPFLAQLFFDDGTRKISEEVDFTRLYKMNKSLKYHMYYTYKLAQLNHEIKMNEYQFVHFIDNKFISQEIDIFNILKDIKNYFIDNQSSIDATQVALKRDKKFIIYLNDLIDVHIDYQIKKENLNRQYLSKFTTIFNRNTHQKADMDITLLNHTSDIRLALKESEIDTIHFKHMYENEKRFLLIQQDRLQSETDINYELISATYLNQMRFAKEQIKLAEEEFKMRLSAIIHNIDSERIHYYEMINHEVKLKEEAAMSEFSQYQKKVYDLINEIEHTDEQKLKQRLEKELKVIKDDYRSKIRTILKKYRDNSHIQLYQKRLDELDMYLEDAYHSASEIYDATTKEMDEVYRYAEHKFQEVMDAIDPEAFPMDDFLYQALQASKKRLSDKMLYANMTLDDKIGDKIDEYKQLYFKLNLKFDSKELINTLNQFEDELTDLDQSYHDQIEDINQEYYLATENDNAKIRHLQLHYQDIINENTQEKNQTIKEKTALINQKDEQFNDFIKQVRKKHKQELNQLVHQYFDHIQNNHKMNQSLKDAQEDLVDQYQPYIKYSKKSKNVKRLIRKTIKENDRSYKSELKSIKKQIKKMQF